MHFDYILSGKSYCWIHQEKPLNCNFSLSFDKGPLHVFWQVSFGCLVTRSISSPLSQIWVMGSRTTEAWSFCKVNALNPLKFTSHKKNWKKNVYFSILQILNGKIKLLSAKSLFFCITVNFIVQKLKFCKIEKEDTLIILLSAWDRSNG